MEWMYYLLEANLYLLLFYGFYKLFLQHETFYNSNRYFLLLSSLTAFILPVLQLGFLKPAPIIDNALFPPPVLYPVEELAVLNSNPVVEPTNYTDYLYPIYLLISLGFAIKLIFSLVKIINLWAKANKKSNGKITIIELDAQKTAFSFFNLLFIHPHLAEKETVFKHELVHIKQKHSLDILFFEILQIICWFNPIIYFIKRDIKLLHEYIADDLSTNQGMQKHEYAMFLIENSFGIMPTPLTNQIFNQSILKRRINMLNKKRTANWARLRLLLALPLASGMLCISTMAFTKNYGYVDLLPEKSNAAVAVEQEVLEIKKTYFPAHEYDEKNNYVSLEKRLIVINGNQIVDNNKYYGTSEADEIIYLNSAAAIKKYGTTKGKYGAVEIIGENAVNTYPPPIVKSTKKTLKAPPAIEPPPAGYKDKQGKINKTPNLNPSSSNFDKVVKGFPLKNNSDKLKEVTVVGYGTQSNPTKVVQGYPINGDKLKEVKIVGHGLQSNPDKVVQGYPINSNGNRIKEVKIQAYPTSNPTKVVQGYPINSTKDELKEVKVIGFQAQSDQNLTGKLGEFKANNNEVKQVKVQAYPQKSNLTGVVKGHPLTRENDDFTGNTIKVSNVVDRTRGKKLIVTTVNNARKSISIYDRWGNLVFTDKNYDNDWDGNFSNVDDLQSKVVEKGTYYYIASTIGNDSKGDLVKGYLTIE